MNEIRMLCIVALAALLAGCQRYAPRPLDPDAVVAAVARERLAPETEAGGEDVAEFSFLRALELAGRHAPAAREAWAEYQTALALAKVKTPLPNPGLEAGPNFSFGPDVTKYRNQPFGALGFTIPTGKRLRRQDELNRLAAERARVEFEVRRRELYLELRLLYSRWTLAGRREAVRREIAASLAQTQGAAAKLREGGAFSALDLGLVQMEAARSRSDTLQATDARLDLEGQLARLIGVHARLMCAPSADLLPLLPAALPREDELRALLVLHHPDLARLRADYEVAEAQLRLEIAKQYPDFHFGPSFEKDGGSRKTTLGLVLGIELPLFDRNQQGIATATGAREAARVKYEAAANRALSALETALSRLSNALERWNVARTELLPRAEEILTLARKSLDAGQTDLLRFLEAGRAQRAARIELLEAEESARAELLDVEQATGCPLVAFPGEAADDASIPFHEPEPESESESETETETQPEPLISTP